MRTIVDQQFEIAQRILDAGLVPIIEPEVDIHAPDKAEAEQLLLKDLTGCAGERPERNPDGDVRVRRAIPPDGPFTGGVVEGAAQRVDEPHPLSVPGAAVPGLLGNHRVIGALLAQEGENRLLGRDVHVRGEVGNPRASSRRSATSLSERLRTMSSFLL